MYKTQSELLSNLLESSAKKREFESPLRIEEVTSEVCSVTSHSSLASTINYKEEQIIGDTDSIEDVDNAELKKFFYSLCLAQKIRNESQKMRVNISAQKLYEEALRKNVPPEKWADYVTLQFANPDVRFTQISHRRRRTSTKLKQNFEAIIEEEESMSAFKRK